jgi:hypothetical protein
MSTHREGPAVVEELETASALPPRWKRYLTWLMSRPKLSGGETISFATPRYISIMGWGIFLLIVVRPPGVALPSDAPSAGLQHFGTGRAGTGPCLMARTAKQRAVCKSSAHLWQVHFDGPPAEAAPLPIAISLHGLSTPYRRLQSDRVPKDKRPWGRGLRAFGR